MNSRQILIEVIVLILVVNLVGAMEVSVQVPSKYYETAPGENLKFEIEIKNIEVAGRHDIRLEYSVTKDGKTYLKDKEIKAVETQASFLSEIKIPDNFAEGIYNLEVSINDEPVAQTTFRVKSQGINLIYILIGLAVAIFITSVMILWEVHKLLKRRRL